MAETVGVSILINSYDYADYVQAAIESALSQDHDRVQVVVVDDGSTDRSPQIIRDFGDRIESRFQENQGQVAACRNGLALAKHDIVIFLDADDLLDADASSKVAAAWHKGVVKIQYSLKVIDTHGAFSGNVFPIYSSLMTPEKVRVELYRSGSYQDSPTSGNAFDKGFLETVMPLMTMRHAPDGELNGLAPLYGDVVTIIEPLGSYRIHGRNSFAQERLETNRFKDYVRQSEDRVAFIRDHYRSKGRTIKQDVLNRDLKYLEYRLVTTRLDGSQNWSMMERVTCLYHTMAAARHAPYGALQRAVRMTWAVAVTISPKPLVRLLVEQRYVPSRRWRWVTSLISLRGSKKTNGLVPFDRKVF